MFDSTRAYYEDPCIEFLLEGDGSDADPMHGRIAGGPIREAGYYIFTHCDPMCCGVCGPFPDLVAAREYSRRELTRGDDGWHKAFRIFAPKGAGAA